VVADGCSIGQSRIHRSVIGVRTLVGNHSTIEDTITMGADFYNPAPLPPWQAAEKIPMGIGNYCHIRKAILDKNVRIGDDVKLLNEQGLESADGEFYHIREGIIIVPKNAVVPSGTRI